MPRLKCVKMEYMSIYIHKSHNVSVLIYHLVCPTKYRRVVIDKKVDMVIKEICEGIEKRYELHFLEIGAYRDHVHFLIQSVPSYTPTKIATIVKSITAKEVFKRNPEVKKELWGGAFWTSGYFISSVGRVGNEKAVLEYVKTQGRDMEYQKIHEDQLILV